MKRQWTIFLAVWMLFLVETGIAGAAATVPMANPGEFGVEFTYNQVTGETSLGAQTKAMLGVQRLVAERAAMVLASRPEIMNRQLSKEDLLALGAAVTDVTVQEKKARGESSYYIKVQGTLRLERLKAVLEDRQALGFSRRLLADNYLLLEQMKSLRKKWEAGGENQRRLIEQEIALNDRRAMANDWYEQGNRFNERREFEKAITAYHKALTFNNQFLDCLNQRGDAYDDKGEYDEAIADYSRALEMDARQAFIYNNRGVAYRHKGDYDAAIADYNRALELDPHCWEAYANRAAAYNFQGQYDKAVADVGQALLLNPQDADSYNNRSVAYISKGQYDDAVADCERALAIDPQYAYGYYNKAVALERAGRKLEASSAYRAFLQYALPDDPLVSTVKQRLSKLAG